MLPIIGKRILKEIEKQFPYGLSVTSNHWLKELKEERNHFLKDWDLLPIIGKRNIKEKEKPIRYGLRLSSNQWPKELKEERQTITLRIKTCFNHWQKEPKGE